MSFQNVTITDPGTGAAVPELVFPRLDVSQTSATRMIRVTNVSASPVIALDPARLVVKNVTGTFSGGTYQQGQEVVTEKWVEARIGAGAWQAIGGEYGNSAPAGNYFALGNIAAGAYVDVELRVHVPATVDTPRIARVRLGVAYPKP